MSKHFEIDLKNRELYKKKELLNIIYNNYFNQIKQNLTINNSNFFEAHLILALDSLKKKDSSSTHSTGEPDNLDTLLPSIFSISSSS